LGARKFTMSTIISEETRAETAQDAGALRDAVLWSAADAATAGAGMWIKVARAPFEAATRARQANRLRQAAGKLDEAAEAAVTWGDNLAETATEARTGARSAATQGLEEVVRIEKFSTPSSKTLARNLEKVGITRPANSAAHHIVPGALEKAADAREILKRAGIDINDASNGVFLPANRKVVAEETKALVHAPLHTDRYIKALTDRLTEAERSGTVADTLQAIAEELQEGTFPH